MQEMLEETLALVRENNKMLKDARRGALIVGIVRVILWLSVIGVSVYLAMKYTDPLLAPFLEASQGSFPADFERLLEQYEAQFGQE